MNDHDLQQLAASLAQLLRPHLERSEPLRRSVSLLGKWLCEEAARIETGIAAPVETHSQPSASESVEGKPVSVAQSPLAADALPPASYARKVAPGPIELPMSSAIVPLKLGDAVVHLPLSGTTADLGRARAAASVPAMHVDYAIAASVQREEVDLAVVETRCRLKADSCRLFIERRAAAADEQAELDTRHRMNEMIARAKMLPSCFLWVFWRERTPPDDATLAMIAESYSALADAAALMRKSDELGVQPNSVEGMHSMSLLAEAKSGLRAALAQTWLSDDDRDQEDAFMWLRRETTQRRVFLDRYMTVHDNADPANSPELRRRIGGAAAAFDLRAAKVKGIRAAINQIRYHAGQIVKDGVGASHPHWAKVADAITRLGQAGIASTDRRIVEAIGTEAGAHFPGDSPHAEMLLPVLEEAGAIAETEEESQGPRAWSKQVLDVRAMLRGRQIVLIGGERNAAAAQRLVEAFDLSNAEWVALTEHGTGAPMRAPICRPETAAVIVIIKLTGHHHADEAKEIADAAGKPCVFLNGGYNPERVAQAIVDQASVRLG